MDKSISDEQLSSLLPGVNKEIRDLVKSIMPHIPLDDDFKLRTYTQIQPDQQQQFLDDQYRLSVAFSRIFKNNLSRILKRDVSDEIDFLFENRYLYNPQFILANTVTQFRMITFLLSQQHQIKLYKHESELPEYFKGAVCGGCGGKLVYRSGASNDNSQGYIVCADEHAFHFTCIEHRLTYTTKCPNCNKQINKDFFDGMSAQEKKWAKSGSNFLSGGERSKRRSLKGRKLKRNSRK